MESSQARASRGSLEHWTEALGEEGPTVFASTSHFAILATRGAALLWYTLFPKQGISGLWMEAAASCTAPSPLHKFVASELEWG